MLNYNFTRIFRARGITRPFAFLRKAGFSVSMSSKIKNNNLSRLDLGIIEKLCLLLNCSPIDFLEWEPSDDSKVNAEHPLNAIRKTNKALDISKTLNSVPLDKLDEVEELIKRHIAEKET